jgi:hypothetical protein
MTVGTPFLVMADPMANDLDRLVTVFYGWFLGVIVLVLSLRAAYPIYQRRMKLVCQYIESGMLSEPKTKLGAGRTLLLALCALVMSGTCTAVGMIGAGYFTPTTNTRLLLWMLIPLGVLVAIGRHLLVRERKFLEGPWALPVDEGAGPRRRPMKRPTKQAGPSRASSPPRVAGWARRGRPTDSGLQHPSGDNAGTVLVAGSPDRRGEGR